MKRSVLVVLLGCAVLASMGTGHATALRTETKPYIASSDGLVLGGPSAEQLAAGSGGILTNDCSGSDTSTGGTCYNVQDADAFIKVTIADQGTAKACGSVQFADDTPNLAYNSIGTSVPIAGSSAVLKLPSGTKRIYVYAFVADGALGTAPAPIGRDDPVFGAKCKTNSASGAATQGTITVSFADSVGF